MAVIGGGQIVDYSFTRAWGVNPASATGKVVGDPAIEAGDYVAYSFGATVFYGIVSEVKASETFAAGATYDFSVLDNRIRLQWQVVFGVWNMEDDRIGRGEWEPASPTGDLSNVPGSGGSDNVNFQAELGGNGPTRQPAGAPPPIRL